MKAKPLGIWDAGDVGNICHRQYREVSAWVTEHLPDKWQAIYRIEFYLIDTAFAVIYEYAINSNGRVYLDEETGQAAKLPPQTVLLTELPPKHLLENNAGNQGTTVSPR